MESEKILKIAAKALDDKKALELNALKIADLTILTEYFLIATATSSTHVHSLADEVEAVLEEAGCKAHHIEGRSTGWIVLDYGSVIVHVFTREQREFYGLDKMWADGETVGIEDLINISEGD
ncbi:MAG: ribosome silencing factor [Clostridia bacterium]|nr:ribosome silencing factor [Clostridia bacterium]